MAQTDTQPPTSLEGRHLVLYDGVCGLCNRLLQFLLGRDHRRVFRFAALQSHAGRSMVERSDGNAVELSSFYVIADYQTANARPLTRSSAALFVAAELGWPWKAARLLRFVPRVIRDAAYDVVARSRYRVFGRLDQCVVPSPDVRDRFID